MQLCVEAWEGANETHLNMGVSPYNLAYTWAILVLLYIIPAVTLAACYGTIGVQVIQAQRMRDRLLDGGERKVSGK